MNKEIEKVAQREFGKSEFIVGFKKGQVKGMSGSFKKCDLKEHFKRLKGVLRE